MVINTAIIAGIKYIDGKNKMIIIDEIKNSELNQFTHISTGGGASLKLLSGELMPAFEAIKI